MKRVSLPLSTLSTIWQPWRQVTHTKLLQIQYYFAKAENPHVNWREIWNARGKILQQRAYLKCLLFSSNLETSSSKIVETGTKKTQFQFRKIVKNDNSLPAPTPAWLPSRPTPKIENLLLGEILMLVCVPPKHQNQLTTVAHQSLTVLIQKRIKIRAKHQNPVPLFVGLLNLQILSQQIVIPKLFALLLTPRLM